MDQDSQIQTFPTTPLLTSRLSVRHLRQINFDRLGHGRISNFARLPLSRIRYLTHLRRRTRGTGWPNTIFPLSPILMASQRTSRPSFLHLASKPARLKPGRFLLRLLCEICGKKLPRSCREV